MISTRSTSRKPLWPCVLQVNVPHLIVHLLFCGVRALRKNVYFGMLSRVPLCAPTFKMGYPFGLLNQEVEGHIMGLTRSDAHAERVARARRNEMVCEIRQ